METLTTERQKRFSEPEILLGLDDMSSEVANRKKSDATGIGGAGAIGHGLEK